jgi:hypothetical protein
MGYLGSLRSDGNFRSLLWFVYCVIVAVVALLFFILYSFKQLVSLDFGSQITLFVPLDMRCTF